METTTFILEPRYRWEPGCELLLCWSEGRTPGFPPIEADGAHSPGSDGVERAMGILSSGSLFNGQYGASVAHGFWRARVWDVITDEAAFPTGRMDIPDHALSREAGERWFSVALQRPASGDERAVASWTHQPDRAAAETAASRPGDGAPRSYVIGIEYLGGNEGSTP